MDQEDLLASLAVSENNGHIAKLTFLQTVINKLLKRQLTQSWQDIQKDSYYFGWEREGLELEYGCHLLHSFVKTGYAQVMIHALQKIKLHALKGKMLNLDHNAIVKKLYLMGKVSKRKERNALLNKIQATIALKLERYRSNQLGCLKALAVWRRKQQTNIIRINIQYRTSERKSARRSSQQLRMKILSVKQIIKIHDRVSLLAKLQCFYAFLFPVAMTQKQVQARKRLLFLRSIISKQNHKKQSSTLALNKFGSLSQALHNYRAQVGVARNRQSKAHAVCNQYVLRQYAKAARFISHLRFVTFLSNPDHEENVHACNQITSTKARIRQLNTKIFVKRLQNVLIRKTRSFFLKLVSFDKKDRQLQSLLKVCSGFQLKHFALRCLEQAQLSSLKNAVRTGSKAKFRTVQRAFCIIHKFGLYKLKKPSVPAPEPIHGNLITNVFKHYCYLAGKLNQANLQKQAQRTATKKLQLLRILLRVARRRQDNCKRETLKYLRNNLCRSGDQYRIILLQKIQLALEQKEAIVKEYL